MSAPLTPADIDRQLRVVIGADTGLSSSFIKYLESLLQAGERLIAFEDLCTQLHEHDVHLPTRLLNSLADVGKQLGAKEHYWRLLNSAE